VEEVNLKDEAAVNNLVQQANSRPVLLRAITNQRYHYQVEWIGETEPGSEAAAAAALDRLQPMVAVSARKGSKFMDVRTTGEDATFVAELANAVARAAIDEIDAGRGELNEEATEFLIKEADRLRNRLKESELAMQSYKAENDAISLDEKKDLVLTTLKSIGEQYLVASAKRLQLETELEACKKGELSEVELLSIPTVANHPKVSATMTELSRLNGEMDVLRQRYKAKHPKYLALDRQIESVNERLRVFLGDVVDLLESSLEGIRSLEVKLEAQLKTRENEALELEKLAVNYNSLRREMETDTAVFQSVLARLKEVDVAQSQDRSPLRIYQSAEPASVPVSPNIRLIVGGSAAGGLGLAIALVIGLVLIDSKIRTVMDAERHFQLPILGVVGEEDQASLSGKGTVNDPTEQASSQKARRGRASYYQQGNHESFRNLRNMVALLGRRDDTRLILLTSALPGEGKTFCASHLAASFAAQGTRTLVIDGDLRRPSLDRYYPSEPNGLGLTDVLLGHVELLAAVRPVDEAGCLYFLACGSKVPNPGELMGNEIHFDRFLQAVRDSGFERILFDSAPLLPVSDTLLLASRMDKVLMVLACNKTPSAATQHAIKRLKEIEVNVSGLILNRFHASRLSGYYYSSYYYNGYYGEAQATPSLAHGKQKA
jgi:polysaccharide biosynthesis transport protein